MNRAFTIAWLTATIGIFATAFLDLFNLLRHEFLGQPLTKYEHIGRWVLYMFDGKFRHESIAKATSIQGELLLGWLGHYGIGILFAAILVGLWRVSWLKSPRLLPAMIVGLATSVVPFFILQPGMGAGIAGTLTSDPLALQLKVLITHAIFGLGLYLAGLGLNKYARRATNSL